MQKIRQRTPTVQVYALTKDAENEAKETVYNQLQKTLDAIPRHDMLLVMRDWNARVRESQDSCFSQWLTG